MDARTMTDALIAYSRLEAEGIVQRLVVKHVEAAGDDGLDAVLRRRRMWEIAWDTAATGPDGRGVWVRIKCVHGDPYVCGLYALRALTDRAGTVERSGVLNGSGR